MGLEAIMVEVYILWRVECVRRIIIWTRWKLVVWVRGLVDRSSLLFKEKGGLWDGRGWKVVLVSSLCSKGGGSGDVHA